MPGEKSVIALCGNPNSGKSTLFNLFTGLHQKTGNYSGVTVEKLEGTIRLNDKKKFTLIDLPGAYSLHPTSEEEKVVLDFILHQRHKIHCIIYALDAGMITRHLLFLSQLMDLKLPVVVALTMKDVLEQEGNSLDVVKLKKELGLPILWVNGRTGDGLIELKNIISEEVKPSKVFLGDKEYFQKKYKNLLENAGFYEPEFDYSKSQSPFENNDYLIENILPDHNEIKFDNEKVLLQENKDGYLQLLSHAKMALGVDKPGEVLKDIKRRVVHFEVTDTMARFHKIEPLVKTLIYEKNKERSFNKTLKADRILTHPLWGSLIFFGLLYLIFISIFSWAEWPMTKIEESFSWASQVIKVQWGNTFFTRFFADGLLPGISGVLVFVPQIAILFGFISLMEETGYMARAVYLADSLLSRFGMNGRSLVSLFSGVACAVPAIMSARTISNQREKLITILVTPFISCSARIPVYTVLIAVIIPASMAWGPFSMRGLIMMFMYFLGAATALGAAWILKKVLKNEELSFLALELPPYRMPHWNNVFTTIFLKVKTFVIDAGKIILVLSVFLWILSSSGPNLRVVNAVENLKSTSLKENWTADEYKIMENRVLLENSYLGIFGKTIEPAIQPLGFDWRIGIAVLSSFAAREVFVGSLLTIFNLDSDEDMTLSKRLQSQVNGKTGKPLFNFASAFSLMIFYAFAMQCMSTIAIVRKETGSYFWPLLQFVAMTSFAYLASLLTYSIFS
jgi:ferrous iron transport protein B